MTLDKIIQLASHTKQDTFPVVDKKNKDAFVGVITFENIRENVMNKENVDGALADDIAVQDYPFVTESEDLHSAMNKFLINDDDSLPVMDKEGGKLLGLLTRTNFINIYNQKFLVLKKPSK
jgi:CBS domain-containing protein